jgi:hypothetical protein
MNNNETNYLFIRLSLSLSNYKTWKRLQCVPCPNTCFFAENKSICGLLVENILIHFVKYDKYAQH